jgi:hypothetical protein
MAIVGVSAMKTRLRLFATLNIENKHRDYVKFVEKYCIFDKPKVSVFDVKFDRIVGQIGDVDSWLVGIRHDVSIFL